MSYPSVDKDRAAWLIPLLVSVFTFAVFLPALRNGFVNWDDTYTIVNNQKFRGLGFEQLKWMFTTSHTGPYQPLSWITLSLDYLVWGMNPFGYHLTNVLLHTINASLFYLLCTKVLALTVRTSVPEEETELRLSAAFTALFFAIHPLRVESVAWVTERRDVLSGFFYLLTILWYLSSRSGDDGKAPFWRRHILPLTTFVLALLSKGMAISLPIVLVVLDIYPLGRLPGDPRKWFSRETRQIWLEKVPFFILAAVFGAIGYAFQAKSGALASYQVFGFVPRITQILFAVFFYIQKTLIPLDLSPLYKLPAGFSLLSWPFMFAGATTATITAAVITLRRRWPAGLAAWICYLAMLSPVVGIVKLGVHSAADRYTYLPCLGFAVLAGAGFRACRQAAGKRFRDISAILACLIISGLALLTWRQEGIWRDSGTLWRYALEINPELDFAHNNLGVFLATQGKLDEAAMHYREAIRINPDYAIAHYDLGNAIAAQGKLDEAARHYRDALRINPDLGEAHYNLGGILAAQGKLDEAAAHCREALRINPDDAEARTKLGVILVAQGKSKFTPDAEARYNLGVVMTEQGKTDEAVKHYREALRISPDYAQAHTKLGVILAAQGKTDEAVMHYREALRINPDSAQTHNNLGLILAAQGKADEAVKHYLEALRIKPDDAHAHNNLGLILAAQGKNDEAANHYRETLRIKPNSVEAHYNLSLILAAQGKQDDAMGHYREALRINPSLRAPAPRKQGK
ncbi:MAG: tetratricopeptide repeat protein [Elusimicrobiota bacterium]|nr:tetratricopeptide repeat protein [Elusimicrobiota bacterium]